MCVVCARCYQFTMSQNRIPNVFIVGLSRRRRRPRHRSTVRVVWIGIIWQRRTHCGFFQATHTHTLDVSRLRASTNLLEHEEMDASGSVYHKMHISLIALRFLSMENEIRWWRKRTHLHAKQSQRIYGLRPPLLRLNYQKISFNCIICTEISIFMCYEMPDEIHFNAKL